MRRKRQSSTTLLDQSCGRKAAKGGLGLIKIKLSAQGNTGLRIGPAADRFEACRLRLTQMYRIGKDQRHSQNLPHRRSYRKAAAPISGS
ncbi:hypothetical protein H9Q09_21060 [Aurantimonas sp. DM33-3]|nr:hypothetical protein [Aurantimonas sp. DM33-3]